VQQKRTGGRLVSYLTVWTVCRCYGYERAWRVVPYTPSVHGPGARRTHPSERRDNSLHRAKPA